MKTCPDCGNEFTQVAKHWQYYPSHRPELGDEKADIMDGIIMGDGTVHRYSGERKPYIRVSMINKRFLEHLDNVFECIGNGIKLERTAEESASSNRKSGFSPSADESNYSDIYYWSTVAHPDLQRWGNWYEGGEKRWPDTISFNENTLKYWYVCDGSLDNRAGRSPTVRLYMSNESDRIDWIDDKFQNVGLQVSDWDTRNMSHGDYNTRRATARFSVEGSRNFFDMVGAPLPGFEHKWPEKYR